MTRRLIPFIAILPLFLLALRAQEAPPANGTAPDPSAAGLRPAVPAALAYDLGLAVTEETLALAIAPLTKGEMVQEVAAWQGFVREKAQEIADLEIKALNGEGDREETNQQLIRLRGEKSALLARAEIVLDSYEIKGGDTADARKYLGAVRGIKTTVNDISSRMQSFNAWFTSQDGGIKVAILAAQFIGTLIVFWFIALFASKIIRRAIDGQPQVSALLKTFINKMSRRVILLIGLIVALGTVGVNVGAALALIGGGAFILAFALQDTLSNFANGIMLIIYRPFDVGDAVEIGGVKGKVDSVSLVSTTILTFDNQKVLVPNKKVWGEVITNITGMATRRVDMLFGIGYGDDVDKAQEIIERVVREHPLILAEPDPNIGLHELADSSVNFRCWPWAKTSDYLTVRTEVTKRIKAEFDAAGISIPFPQRDIHLYRKDMEKGS
jgi:small conductance mechanosensitive channel